MVLWFSGFSFYTPIGRFSANGSGCIGGFIFGAFQLPLVFTLYRSLLACSAADLCSGNQLH